MDLVFTGIVHPGNTGDGPNDFPVGNLQDLDLDGCKVFIEHKIGPEAAGSVVATHTYPRLEGETQGPKLVTCRLSPHTSVGADAIHKIRTGTHRQLSLQHDFLGIRVPGGILQSRRGLEVSITPRGRRPNCHILHYHLEKSAPAEHNSVTYSLHPNMAEDAESTAPPAEDAPIDKTSHEYWLQTLSKFNPEQQLQVIAEAAAAQERLTKENEEKAKSLEELSKRNEELERQSKTAYASLKQQTMDYIDKLSKLREQPPNAAELLEEGLRDKPDLMHLVLANAASQSAAMEERERKYEEFQTASQAQSKSVQEEFERLRSGFSRAGAPTKRVAPEPLSEATGVPMSAVERFSSY